MGKQFMRNFIVKHRSSAYCQLNSLFQLIAHSGVKSINPTCNSYVLSTNLRPFARSSIRCSLSTHSFGCSLFRTSISFSLLLLLLPLLLFFIFFGFFLLTLFTDSLVRSCVCVSVRAFVWPHLSFKVPN